jgi:indole-3-glycerol phosphate synthase
MPEILPAIVACARRRVAAHRVLVPDSVLREHASHAHPRGQLFEAQLGHRTRINVIAECKRRSPAKGVLQRNYDPCTIAQAYASGGAAAISVLTEPCFFDGALGDVSRVRAAVDVPVLRKDFIVDEYQVHEARAAGADAVLLIVSVLKASELTRLLTVADEAGLAALVEVHDGRELEQAVVAGARLLGVNCRDLRTLKVQQDVFAELASQMPAHGVAVAESGMASAGDVRRFRDMGYHAFLIGEWLMTALDPRARLAGLLGEVQS